MNKISENKFMRCRSNGRVYLTVTHTHPSLVMYGLEEDVSVKCIYMIPDPKKSCDAASLWVFKVGGKPVAYYKGYGFPTTFSRKLIMNYLVKHCKGLPPKSILELLVVGHSIQVDHDNEIERRNFTVQLSEIC